MYLTRLNTDKKNAVLKSMIGKIAASRKLLLEANFEDMNSFDTGDKAMYDRLKLDDEKIDEMMRSLKQLVEEVDPVGLTTYTYDHGNGMEVANKTAPFGTVMIIYESRPDVTVEAAGVAFKSGNRILLKGGKESLNSNRALVKLWKEALLENEVEETWMSYLNLSREQTREYLKSPEEKLDLIVPRGGEQLIQFVKENASCPVIVSGRGNNFIYVDNEVDKQMAIDIIINAKTSKISACNALDKVLLNSGIGDIENFTKCLVQALLDRGVQVLRDQSLEFIENVEAVKDQTVWYEEFLDYKIVIGCVDSLAMAIEKINKFSGGHSATIVTDNKSNATSFQDNVDAAAVYHNASTRFTDGGQLGMGAELAISTDKLHHRGPLGLQQLVTNKWYINGNGQVR
jgi:glutamate-5-semialdehyde dehydrogenase